MGPPNITTTLATEKDAPQIASVMTSAFAASDAAYSLIWGSAEEDTHDKVSIFGLFSPVQKQDRVTFKAVDEKQKLLGFATWNLPQKTVSPKSGIVGLPEIPGVNMQLWNDKVKVPREFHERDVDPKKDMHLSFLFVDPEYQRLGIGTQLLKWGVKKADELKAKIWITSTPQAVRTYEKNGWKVVERHEVILENYGGHGVYGRAWMLREPNLNPSS